HGGSVKRPRGVPPPRRHSLFAEPVDELVAVDLQYSRVDPEHVEEVTGLRLRGAARRDDARDAGQPLGQVIPELPPLGHDPFELAELGEPESPVDLAHAVVRPNGGETDPALVTVIKLVGIVVAEIEPLFGGGKNEPALSARNVLLVVQAVAA